MTACVTDVYKCSLYSFGVLSRPCSTISKQSFTMASQYPQYPRGHPTGYGPRRSSNAQYNSPPMGQMPLAPYGTPAQTRVDAHGRPIAQQGINNQSYPVTRGQSNHYITTPSLNSPVYSPQEMTRDRSSQSTSTSGSVPSPQSTTAGPKE
jgi:hypothetical protein